ncbi:unnamed protein product [Symbiodinium microadriaticum]|nr:unnamed protein product [Symbiodinium microadriaticum]
MPQPRIPEKREAAEDADDPEGISIQMPGLLEDQFARLREGLEADVTSILVRLAAIEEALGLPKASQAEIPEAKPSSLEVTTGAGGLSPADQEPGDLTEVCFEASTWSVPLLIGLVDAGWIDHAFAIILVLLNLFMQVAFTWVLLSEGFMGDGLEKEIDSAKIWRTSVAHDAKYLDLSSTSLVSRVCNGDSALILSTTQAILVNHINSFLGLEKTQIEYPFWQPGMLLCLLCIVFWSLCIYQEFRKIWQQLEATIEIPKSHLSVFRNNSFQSLSWSRFVVLLIIYLVRAVIASLLMGAGILWLARTTSIEELMLNAVALNAVLDVDEFLFEGMAPIKIRQRIHRLEPVQVSYSRCRSQFESLVHFVSLVALILVVYFSLLVPLGDTMLKVKNELCGGTQTFIVRYNEDTQIPYGLSTTASRDYGSLSPVELAVFSHKANSPESMPDASGSTYILFSANKALFEEESTRNMAEQASNAQFCVEVHALNQGGMFSTDIETQLLARRLLNNAATSVGRSGASSCGELSDLCDLAESRLLRWVCADTCGCLDPYSSPWYKVAAQGCSPTCVALGQQRLQNSSCQDVPPEHHSWRSFWLNYGPAISGFLGQDIQSFQAFATANQSIQAMLSGGCPMLLQFPADGFLGAAYCDGHPGLFRPLASLCPQSCRCSALPFESTCPPSCRASNRSS